MEFATALLVQHKEGLLMSDGTHVWQYIDGEVTVANRACKQSKVTINIATFDSILSHVKGQMQGYLRRESIERAGLPQLHPTPASNASIGSHRQTSQPTTPRLACEHMTCAQ